MSAREDLADVDRALTKYLGTIRVVLDHKERLGTINRMLGRLTAYESMIEAYGTHNHHPIQDRPITVTHRG